MTKPESLDRILFCSSFTPPVNAGSGLNTFSFAQFVAQKGNDVTLLSVNRMGRYRRKEQIGHLKIIRLLYFNSNYLTKLFSLLLILPGYFISIIKHDVIFIYGGNLIAFEFIILTARVLKKKVIFRSTMFGEDDVKSLTQKRIFGKLRKAVIKQVSFYYSINTCFAETWINLFNSDLKLFRSVHGVNTEIFSPVSERKKIKLQRKLSIPEKNFIIITVGFLIERKGFKQVYEALENLEIPYKYIIVGDYTLPDDHYLRNYKPEMKNLYQIGMEKLNGNLIFIGPKENVQDYINASDIFILNSDKEGFPPNFVMEGMACGLPGIVKDIYGIENMVTIRDQNILIAKSKEDISNMVNNLYFNVEKRVSLGKAAAKKISECGSFEIIWKRLKDELNIYAL